MNLKSSNTTFRFAMRFVSCSVFCLLLACAQKPESSEPAACVKARDVSLAFQSVAAQKQLLNSSGRYQLLAKINSSHVDVQSLKQELLTVADENDLVMKRLNSDRWLIEFSNSSPAKAVIESAIESGKILALEQDQVIKGLDARDSDFEAQATDLMPPPTLTASAMKPAIGREIIVAVIDTGVDYNHKDLEDFMWTNAKEIAGNSIDDDQNGYVDDIHGWDFVNEDNQPMADDTKSYHGTHVAGIVKQAALLAGTGVNLKIMALKYLDSGASGRTSNAIRAIDYAIKNGAIILNNSWGSFSASTALAESVERSRLAGTLFLAASGNGDSNGVGINIDERAFYPASFTHGNVISVSASNSTGILAGWANYGAKNVDLAAPGVSILSARNGDAYARLTGTSMATPYVAGVAAMLWSQRPDLSPTEIRKIILSTAKGGQSYQGKMTTEGNIDWSASVVLAETYQHAPNDKGVTEIIPQEICSN